MEENAPVVVFQDPGGHGEAVAHLGVDGLDILGAFRAGEELGLAGLGIVAGIGGDPAAVAEHDQGLRIGI